MYMVEKKLQAFLNFAHGCTRPGAFNIEVPLIKINCHISVAILQTALASG